MVEKQLIDFHYYRDNFLGFELRKDCAFWHFGILAICGTDYSIDGFLFTK